MTWAEEALLFRAYLGVRSGLVLLRGEAQGRASEGTANQREEGEGVAVSRRLVEGPEPRGLPRPQQEEPRLGLCCRAAGRDGLLEQAALCECPLRAEPVEDPDNEVAVDAESMQPGIV